MQKSERKISEALVSFYLIRQLAVGYSWCIEPVLFFTNLKTVAGLGYKPEKSMVQIAAVQELTHQHFRSLL